jgi:tRNA-(ms[2]io[6]A)-hydroxylase
MSGPRSHSRSAARPSGYPGLKAATSPQWVTTVLEGFDAFLLDHAACERKASATALTFVSHYPDRRLLVDTMVDLAREELDHFAQVYRLLADRGLTLGPDRKDPYVNRLAAEFRKGSEVYFLDRLLVCGIVEARACERFGLLSRALPPGPVRDFYRDLTASEARHRGLYVRLAGEYFESAEVDERLEELLTIEADVLRKLPLRPAMH